jgi:uncharacterized OsmC-like protein
MRIASRGDAMRVDSPTPTRYACTKRGSSHGITQHASWHERIPMSTLTLAYAVHTYSSGTHGRAICNARTHHFVSDDVGGDAVGAGELFLSGVSACAVNMVERLAKQDHIPLQWMDVRVEAYRDSDKSPGDLTVFDAIRVDFEMWGITPEHAEGLVETWKRRCPLYGSVATATEDTAVTLTSHVEPRGAHA